mgnify:CR=1 FL=1
MTELKDQLSLLGRKTEYKQDYAPEVLEAFDNKHLPGVHQPLPDNGTARFCGNPHQLHSRCENGGEQESEALSLQFPQSRRFPRGLRQYYNERPHPSDESQVH